MASAKLLLLTNYRPEYRHEWGQKTYYTQLRLAPLGKEETEEFLEVLLGESSAPKVGAASGRSGGQRPPPLSTLKHLILDKTEGTPFFMEEIVQELREQGVLRQDAAVGWVVTQPTLTLQLPPTVQGILAARIDRLTPDEIALLQQLAVIGRQFPVSLIRQVIAQPEAELYGLLASLQRKEFLYEQPAFPEVEYIFKHALTQEVAYGTVLHEQRKLLHERTGQALERTYVATLSEHYSDLAHHYRRSGNAAKAVEYLSLAGQQALRRSATAEAVTHFTAALELLKTLPDTPERSQQELTLQVALGAPLMANKGYGAPEVERTFTRAREFCHQMGATPQIFSVLWGLHYLYFIRAKYETARELVEQLFGLAQSVQDPALMVEAHFLMGGLFFSQGEFAPAREHYEQGIVLYNPKQHHSHAFLYGQDPGVTSLSVGACVLWHLGYPERARQESHAALTLARELSHPFSLAYALASAAWLHLFREEGHASQELAESAITLCTEQGFPFLLAWATSTRGWALAKQGQGEEGIVQIRQGIAALQVTGAEVFRSHHLTLLA